MKRRDKNPEYDSIPFLTVVVYLSCPIERPAAVGARICRLMLEQLGNHRVRIGAHWDGDKHLVEEQHRDYLRAIVDRYEDIVPKIRPGKRLVLGTGMPHYWGFFYQERMVLPAGTSDGFMNVDLYMDLFERLNKGSESGAWLPFVLDLVRVLDNEVCYCGLAQTGFARDLDYGLYYGDNVRDLMTWREAVEHVDWLSPGEHRRLRVRAPTWGTYLGKALVERLDKGEKGSFLQRYLEPRGAEPTHSGVELPSGAIFVTTSNNPMEAVELPLRRHNDPVVENAVWLWQEFRKAGMV